MNLLPLLTSSRTFRFGILWVWFTGGLTAIAQPENRPSDRQKPPASEIDGEGRDRSEGRGSRPGGRSMRDGRGSPWGDDFSNLSEDEKKRVREALAKVWVRPEVVSARERIMKANEEMRETIRLAVIDVDPTVATLLEKVRPPGGGFGGPGGPSRERPLAPLPEPESPEFPRAVVKRLVTEMLMSSPPDRRERIQEMHGKMMERPEIRAAVEGLESAAPGERLEAVENLRKLYREAFAGVFKSTMTRGPGGGSDRGDGGGFRRPPPKEGERPRPEGKNPDDTPPSERPQADTPD